MALKGRVLVAQPSPTLQMLVRVTLQAESLEVACVSDGRGALRAARDEHWDLVIADRELAGLDGYEVAEELVHRNPDGAAPVLLVVPDHDTPDPDRMLRAGIRDALPRPFERHDLVERVRWLLEAAADRSSPSPTAAEEASPADEPDLDAAPPPAAARAEPAPVDERDTPAQDAPDRRSVEPEDAPAAPAAEPPTAAATEARLTRLVDERLPELVEARLGDALRSLLEGPLHARLQEAARAAAPSGPPEVSSDALDGAVRRVLREEGEELIRPMLQQLVEPVVWKVVPELAEDLIRDELHRLTAEEEPDEQPPATADGAAGEDASVASAGGTGNEAEARREEPE